VVAGEEGPSLGVATTELLCDDAGYTYGVLGVAQGMEISCNPKDSSKRIDSDAR
jgi:hypothetical protein